MAAPRRHALPGLRPSYQVHWGREGEEGLGGLLADLPGGAKAAVAAPRSSSQGRRSGSKASGSAGLGWILGAHGVCDESLDCREDPGGNATGAALASLIARTTEGPYVLIGHSLGARVMVTAAEALARAPVHPASNRSTSSVLPSAGRATGVAFTAPCPMVCGTTGPAMTPSCVALLACRARRARGRPRGFRTKFANIHDRNVTRRVASHLRLCRCRQSRRDGLGRCHRYGSLRRSGYRGHVEAVGRPRTRSSGPRASLVVAPPRSAAPRAWLGVVEERHSVAVVAEALLAGRAAVGLAGVGAVS